MLPLLQQTDIQGSCLPCRIAKDDIPDGFYNVVIDLGEKFMTARVDILGKKLEQSPGRNRSRSRARARQMM